MTQYIITTQNLTQASDEDCYLAPDDPIHQLKATAMMGGLGASSRLAQYNQETQNKVRNELLNQRNDAIKAGIKPGSPAWHALSQQRNSK